MQTRQDREVGLRKVLIHVGNKDEIAYNMSDSASYLDISGTALQNRLKSLKQKGKEIKRYQLPIGRDKYLLKKDLDKLLEARQA